MPLRFIGLLAVIAIATIDCPAVTVEMTPEGEWFRELTSGQREPGDVLVFRQGVYSDARRLTLRLRGRKDKPIVIRAATGERVVFRRPDAKQNTFNLEGCQHLTLSGLEITGGAAAIRIGASGENQSHSVVLEDLHIHHITGVAVTCNSEGASYRDMVFRRNHIHHTAGHGEAFYLGANHAKAIFSHSVVANNYIHHLSGPRVSQGDGIEIKLGSYANRIVGNVIHDTRYPGITLYGTEGGERNVVETNVIWNTGDHGIQVAADAIIRNNYIARPGGCGIYSREHQGAVPNHLRIEENHVVAGENPALRLVGSDSGGNRIEVLGNSLFAHSNQVAVRIDNLDRVIASGNRGSGVVTGSDSIADSFGNAALEPPTLPALDGHPVWNHLRPAAVLGPFAAE